MIDPEQFADDDTAICSNLGQLIASLNATGNLSPEGEASALRGLRMREAERLEGARGRNDYALTDYGLDEGVVREAYADYIARFAIPREADALR